MRHAEGRHKQQTAGVDTKKTVEGEEAMNISSGPGRCTWSNPLGSDSERCLQAGRQGSC